MEQGRLGTAACVGVRSDETPRELEESADTLVDGTAGVRQLLEALQDRPSSELIVRHTRGLV